MPSTWDAYHLGSPSKVVDWKHCNMTSYQWNMAGIAFNNWNAKFQQGTSNNHLGSGCSYTTGMEMYVLGSAGAAMEIECGIPAIACYRMSAIGGGAYFNDYCACVVLKVTKAEIVFDAIYWNDLWDLYKQMHVFAHEFGHGMGIGHLHACGTSVMSGKDCDDLVHGWPPHPNDVCSPDILYGYSGPWGARCQ